MVKKRTVGKIQLSLGIIIILIGLLGLIFASNIYQKVQGEEDLVRLSGAGIALDYALSSGLAIILSVLFITQGLVNISGDK